MKGPEKPGKARETLKMLAVIRIRGSAGVPRKLQDTLEMLRLRRVNHCVIIPKTPDFEGMLRKAGGYVTWGEIKPEILDALVVKRGRLQGNKRIDKKMAKPAAKALIEKSRELRMIKPVFRLSPPSRGFKSIRAPFPRGDSGYRGEKINELLERMI